MPLLERVLRGLLLGALAFAAASGAATLPFARPSFAVQTLMVVHRDVGVLCAVLGVAYVGVHLVQVFGVGRLLSRRALRVPAGLAGAALALLGGLSSDPGYALHLALNIGLVMLAVVACALALRGVGRAVRSRQGAGAAGSGGLALVVAIVAVVSGLLIPSGIVVPTGTELDVNWALHAVASPLALALGGLHVARSRVAARRGGERRRYAWRVPLLALALPVVVVLAAGAALRMSGLDRQVAARAPVEGTIAATDPDLAGMAEEGCATCHAAVVEDWRLSAHARGADNPLFTAMMRRFYAEGRRDVVRFCLGCHAPHALDPESHDVEAVLASEGYAVGVHCVSCHRSSPGPERGDGSFSVDPLVDDDFVFLSDLPRRRGDRSLAMMLVSSRLSRHLEQFRFASHDERSCMPCHVQTLAHPTDGRLHDVLQDQYDSWTRSPASAADVGCSDCHMPRYITEDVYHARDHRFAAASTYLAWLSRGPDGAREVARGLEGDRTVRPIVFGRSPEGDGGPLLEMELARVEHESGAVLRVRTRNTGRIGHSFPNGPTDLIQVWLSVRAHDAEGRVLMDLGADGPEGAPRLGHRFVDADGAPIEDHRLWAVARVAHEPVIPEQGWHELELALPGAAAAGSLTVEAAWNYRRLDPELVRRLTGTDAAEGLPIARVARVEARLGG